MSANAFLNWGSYKHWTGEQTEPLDGIGITLGHGSWPVWAARDATTQLRVWPNPELWDQPGRYGTVPAWNVGGRFTSDPLRRRYPAAIPWDAAWSGAGGTQAHASDNGLIVEYGDGTAWTLQGTRPGHAFDGAAIAARCSRWWPPNFAAPYRPGDMIADAIRWVAPGVPQRGSQGPISKLDGLLRPEHLAGPWGRPVRLVGFNVAHGPGAKAVAPGWVEHPRAGQRAASGGLPVALPEGDDPRMVRPFTLFRLDITDDDIMRWLDDQNITDGVLRTSKGWFAQGLRDRGMRLAETGTGQPILESSGGVNPDERQRWADRGIRTDRDARELGAGLFRYGTLYDASET